MTDLKWVLVAIAATAVVMGTALWIATGSPGWLLRVVGSAAIGAAAVLGLQRRANR